MKKILFALALAVVATACHTNEGDQAIGFGKIADNINFVLYATTAFLITPKTICCQKVLW